MAASKALALRSIWDIGVRNDFMGHLMSGDQSEEGRGAGNEVVVVIVK